MKSGGLLALGGKQDLEDKIKNKQQIVLKMKAVDEEQDGEATEDEVVGVKKKSSRKHVSSHAGHIGVVPSGAMAAVTASSTSRQTARFKSKSKRDVFLAESSAASTSYHDETSTAAQDSAFLSTLQEQLADSRRDVSLLRAQGFETTKLLAASKKATHRARGRCEELQGEIEKLKNAAEERSQQLAVASEERKKREENQEQRTRRAEAYASRAAKETEHLRQWGEKILRQRSMVERFLVEALMDAEMTKEEPIPVQLHLSTELEEINPPHRTPTSPEATSIAEAHRSVNTTLNKNMNRKMISTEEMRFPVKASASAIITPRASGEPSPPGPASTLLELEDADRGGRALAIKHMTSSTSGGHRKNAEEEEEHLSLRQVGPSGAVSPRQGADSTKDSTGVIKNGDEKAPLVAFSTVYRKRLQLTMQGELVTAEPLLVGDMRENLRKSKIILNQEMNKIEESQRQVMIASNKEGDYNHSHGASVQDSYLRNLLLGEHVPHAENGLSSTRAHDHQQKQDENRSSAPGARLSRGLLDRIWTAVRDRAALMASRQQRGGQRMDEQFAYSIVPVYSCQNDEDMSYDLRITEQDDDHDLNTYQQHQDCQGGRVHDYSDGSSGAGGLSVRCSTAGSAPPRSASRKTQHKMISVDDHDENARAALTRSINQASTTKSVGEGAEQRSSYPFSLSGSALCLLPRPSSEQRSATAHIGDTTGNDRTSRLNMRRRPQTSPDDQSCNRNATPSAVSTTLKNDGRRKEPGAATDRKEQPHELEGDRSGPSCKKPSDESNAAPAHDKRLQNVTNFSFEQCANTNTTSCLAGGASAAIEPRTHPAAPKHSPSPKDTPGATSSLLIGRRRLVLRNALGSYAARRDPASKFELGGLVAATDPGRSSPAEQPMSSLLAAGLEVDGHHEVEKHGNHVEKQDVVNEQEGMPDEDEEQEMNGDAPPVSASIGREQAPQEKTTTPASVEQVAMEKRQPGVFCVGSSTFVTDLADVEEEEAQGGGEFVAVGRNNQKVSDEDIILGKSALVAHERAQEPKIITSGTVSLASPAHSSLSTHPFRAEQEQQRVTSDQVGDHRAPADLPARTRVVDNRRSDMLNKEVNGKWTWSEREYILRVVLSRILEESKSARVAMNQLRLRIDRSKPFACQGFRRRNAYFKKSCTCSAKATRLSLPSEVTKSQEQASKPEDADACSPSISGTGNNTTGPSRPDASESGKHEHNNDHLDFHVHSYALRSKNNESQPTEPRIGKGDPGNGDVSASLRKVSKREPKRPGQLTSAEMLTHVLATMNMSADKK
ncbi:unnamed protein product [Amoebophrya sp. A25]|nr:unnamed protein product [Amoebophrya sp. A25]|eukprot:GSA25T00013864001.1